METYDVIVIGGGAAGLSGAATLGRALRTVLVIDAGEPRNAPADAVHTYLGLDGVSPQQLLATGRDEVARYGGTVMTGNVVAVSGERSSFVVELASGETFGARRLLTTTGLVDELPDIQGLRERWGRDVLHCPYCHGWEFRGEPIGIIGTGPMSVHQALLFRGWSDDITLFVRDAFVPSANDLAKLAARNITVVNDAVTELVVEDDRLTGVRLADGTVVARRAVAVGSRMVARAGLLTTLGVTMEEHPTGMGEYVAVNEMGETSVPGIYAAGNVSDIGATVVIAAGAASKAAGMINADLLGLFD